MTKQEFTDALRSRLSEELDAAEVNSQVRYYEGYLDGEIARGKTEEEAVGVLGDPFLIAKTIIESPREESFFGRTVQDAESSYYEGAFQAENEGNVSSGHHEESTSYGTREENTSYGNREENTSYGTREENTSYGSHEESMSYGTREEEAFSGGPHHAAFEDVKGTVEGSKRGFMRDINGDFNWGLFALILAVIMIFVAVVWIVTRVIIGFGPVILVILAVLLIVRTIRGER